MKQALSGPDAERWKASMEKKLDTFEKMGVWRDVLSTKRGLPVTL